MSKTENGTGVVRKITERKRVDAALRENEARLAQAQRMAKLGHWSWHAGSEKLQPSPEMAAIFGVPLEKLAVGYAEFLKFVHPNDRGETNLAYGSGVNISESYETEYRIIRPDGEVRYIFEIGEPSHDAAGKPVSEFGTVQDITERVRAEAALRLSEERLTTMERIAKVGHWAWDEIEDREIYTSEEARNIFGSILPEHDFEAFLGLVHPDDRERVRVAIKQAPLAQTGYQVEYRIVRPDGEMLFVVEQGEFEFDDDGKPVRSVGTVRDITERKRAEEALHESETRYREIFDESPVGIWEDDWSDVKRMLDDLMASGVTDLRTYFHDNPDKAMEAYDLSKIVDISRATYELYDAPNKQALMDWTKADLESNEEIKGFLDSTIAFMDGEVEFEFDSPCYGYEGVPIVTSNRLVIPPNYRHDWSRVIYAVEDITERVRTEQAIRASEAQLRRAQDIARIGSFEWDERKDEVIYRSNVIYDIYGVPPDGWPRTIDENLELIHPDDRERMRAAYAEALGSGEEHDLEYRVVRPDGEVRYIHAISTPEFNESGEHVRSIGTLQDITESKLAGVALRESEAALENAQRVAHIGNWRWSIPRNALISCSAEYARIHGVGCDEIHDFLSRYTEDIIHADDRARVEAAFRRFDELGADYEIEYRIVRPDGEVRHVVEIGKGAIVGNNRPAECVGTLQDITERVQAEAVIRANDARLRRAQEIARIGSFEWDERKDEIIYRSDMTYDIYGVPPGGWPRTTDETLALTHPDDRERIRAAYAEALGSGKGYDLEYRIVRPDNEVGYVHEISAPEFNESGEHVRSVGTVQDITEHKRAEEQLRQAQKMEAVGQLTAGVAHDFNNLLAVIIGNVEFLEDSVGGDENAQQHIEAVIGAVERASSLTSRLLAFSRRQPLSPVAADVTGLIGGLEDMLCRTLGETIELRVEATPDLRPAMIDPHQFENALVNLAVNARDAMPQGGTLTIETANVTLDETYAAQQEEVTPGDYVYVAVSDTGSGMPPEVLEKVFEPFFTTKEVGKGSGLGLSMVYGFAKQSGGHITIYSEVGHGTTVKLYMPCFQEAAVMRDPEDDTPDVVLGSERILVVEDDERVRAMSVNILRNQGCEIVEAKDGAEAVNRLKDDRPFDLLFTDVVLPGAMNGVEIAEQAKRLQPNIKVLFTTGYAENVVDHHGKLDPGATLINKPYRRAELLEKVQVILDSEEG